MAVAALASSIVPVASLAGASSVANVRPSSVSVAKAFGLKTRSMGRLTCMPGPTQTQTLGFMSLEEIDGDIFVGGAATIFFWDVELAALGLVQLQKGRSESWYIPTKLASNLSASLSESADWQPSEGFVVVETNFKVYAYTSSKLQTEIIRCFARLLPLPEGKAHPRKRADLRMPKR